MLNVPRQARKEHVGRQHEDISTGLGGFHLDTNVHPLGAQRHKSETVASVVNWTSE